jgi:uncharacterized protein
VVNAVLTLSRYHVVSEPLQDVTGGPVRVVLFGTRRAEGVVVDVASYRAIAAGRFDSLDEALIGALIDAELLIPRDENELTTILARNRAAIDDFKTFNVVVQPTAACQFACGYCAQKHEATSLSDDDMRRLTALVASKLATGKFTALKASWHGGEPLLGLNGLRRLSVDFQAAAASHGCTYTSNITTNGYTLTPDLAEELVSQHKVNEIQITLDGDAASHDQTRVRHGGGGTFDTVFANVVAVAERMGLRAGLAIRCNVHKQNRDSVVTLIDTLAAAGLHDKLKNVYFVSLHDWGNRAGDEAMTKEQFAEMEIGWMARLLSHGFRVSLVPSRVSVTCLAVKNDGFVVDPRGRLYNCPEPPLIQTPTRLAASDTAATATLPVDALPAEADYFAIGSLEHGVDDTRRSIIGQFFDIVERHETPCATCPVLGVCGGACPKHWLQGNPPCPSFKWNLSEKLRLQMALDRRSRALNCDASTPLVDLCSY